MKHLRIFVIGKETTSEQTVAFYCIHINFRTVLANTLEMQEYVELINKRSYNGAISYSIYDVWYLNQNINDPIHRFTTCKEILLSVPVVIFTKKDFFLLNVLNEKIERFQTSGLIEYWHKKCFNGELLRSKPSLIPQVITIYKLLGCFQIWLGGLIVAVFVFIVEFIA